MALTRHRNKLSEQLVEHAPDTDTLSNFEEQGLKFV